jgi:hypothetical protein
MVINADADLARMHKLTFVRPGYKIETRTARAADGAVNVHLTRLPSGRGGGNPRGAAGPSMSGATDTPPKSTGDTPAPTPSGFKENPF